MKTIGARIRQLRNIKNLTLEELAKKADISSRRLQDIEHNKSDPKTSTLVSIAAALETTVGYLLCEEENTA